MSVVVTLGTVLEDLRTNDPETAKRLTAAIAAIGTEALARFAAIHDLQTSTEGVEFFDGDFIIAVAPKTPDSPLPAALAGRVNRRDWKPFGPAIPPDPTP